jgi:hypothetical protein|tara:strand:- start:389 stop:592 length:204 start_codon:yes stop_codon:yes gene_type:complete
MATSWFGDEVLTDEVYNISEVKGHIETIVYKVEKAIGNGQKVSKEAVEAAKVLRLFINEHCAVCTRV